MPTIKTKKEMNLPELIEWIEKNRRFGETFDSNRYNYVDVNVDGVLSFTGNFCEDIFTVEIEEEITEDTVVPKIAELNLCGYDQHEGLFVNENKSIKQLLSEEETNNIAFYNMNDDLTLTLIWTQEKGLVE